MCEECQRQSQCEIDRNMWLIEFRFTSRIMSSVGSSSSTATFCSRKQSNWLMDHEAVPLHQRGKFQMLYESVFNNALNTKRSSCKQAGGKIVRESIATFREQGEEEFFTIDELCKLRRATTERERKAFFWFFGSFLECVC